MAVGVGRARAAFLRHRAPPARAAFIYDRLADGRALFLRLVLLADLPDDPLRRRPRLARLLTARSACDAAGSVSGDLLFRASSRMRSVGMPRVVRRAAFVDDV